MVRINKSVFKLMGATVLWSILWMCEFIFFFLMLGEWHEYPLQHDLIFTDASWMDSLHFKLLYAFCISMSVLWVMTTLFFYSSLIRCLKLLRKEESSEDVSCKNLFSVVPAFHIDQSGCCLYYEGRTIKVPPRVALFLNALVQKEEHIFSLEEFNELFYTNYYDGTESSLSRIRNIKSMARKALQETPFDVKWGTSRELCLILKS